MQPKAKTFRFRASSTEPWFATHSCLVILAVNWLAQGMRGMDPKELSFRLLLLCGLTGLLAAVLVAGPVAAPGPALLLGLGLAHSINFTLNGQLWVCLRYCPAYRQDPVVLATRTGALVRRVRRSTWLQEAVLIGSAARLRSLPGPRSDIDLRLIFPPGWSGWLRTNLLLLELRARALFVGLPLDLYAYDHPAQLRRFEQTEPLALVLDRQARLCRGFANRELVRIP
jgi:hypothetical protein